MPEPGRAYVTFPKASKCVSPREILILAFVPCGNHSAVTAKHPNRLRSFVCPEMCFSDCSSVSSILAMNWWRGAR